MTASLYCFSIGEQQMTEFQITPQEEIKLQRFLDMIRPVTDPGIFQTIEKIIKNAVARKKITNVEVDETISLLDSQKNKKHMEEDDEAHNKHTAKEQLVQMRNEGPRNVFLYQEELLRFKHYLRQRFRTRNMRLSRKNNRV